MPSEKRARKRAQRDAKFAALERQRKRRAGVRRTVTVLVLVAVAVGLYAWIRSGGSKKPASAARHPTTTTTTTLPPGAVSTTTTVKLAGYTTSARCPANFSSTLKKPSWKSPPPMIIDPTKSYSATVNTDVGPFTIALDASAAPKTVNNFVFLAENHFYDCEAFWRVVSGFMDQNGSPAISGNGGPGYSIPDENIPSSGYSAGDVAMANKSAPNTGGSQFFVLVSSYSHDNFALFGHVTSGMSVVQKINSQGGSSNTGTPEVLHRIVSVIISES